MVWSGVGDMSRAKDMRGGIGRRVVMCWRWSWRRSGFGTTRGISGSTPIPIPRQTANEYSYVHRLIQTRNDGKLVELPSASSLVTPSVSRALPLSSITTPTRSPSTQTHANSNGNHTAGPSTNDLEKISTIESITLEYSYLLSSQLEAMRQHYASQSARLATLEAAEKRALEAERAKETAERRAEKASELSRSLQASLSAERAMSEGLSTRVKSLKEAGEAKERQGREKEKERREKEDEVKVLEETVRDLMFSLEAGVRIQAAGGAEGGEGGDLVVLPGEREKEEKRKKKGKK